MPFRDEGIHVDHGRMVYSLSREWSLDQGMDPVIDINSAEEDGIFDNAYPTSYPATCRELRLLRRRLLLNLTQPTMD